MLQLQKNVQYTVMLCDSSGPAAHSLRYNLQKVMIEEVTIQAIVFELSDLLHLLSEVECLHCSHHWGSTVNAGVYNNKVKFELQRFGGNARDWTCRGHATETEVTSDIQMVLQMLWRPVSVRRKLQLKMSARTGVCC